MFRSRIELADTLCEMEKGHQKHKIETKLAEERTKELEVALRAADEVGRLLCVDPLSTRPPILFAGWSSI